MIRTFTLILLTTLLVSGCSYFSRSPQPRPMPVDNKAPEIISEIENPRTGVTTITTKKTKRFVADKSKPASFSDYKKWRRENDPGGQVYAEFKQWEAALKARQLRQQKNKAK